MSLHMIERGLKPAPHRVFCYGTHGVGKSTWAAGAPRPIFIPTEDGLAGLEVDRFPLVTRYDEVIAALSSLYSEDHSYETVVIDSADWLERLIWTNVCEQRSAKAIDDFGFARGYAFALTQWTQVLDGLSALRNERGMTIIILAHSRIAPFNNPETESYDRFSPRLYKSAASLLMEWADEVLFATYKVYTKTTDEGFNRKRTHGVGGERVLRTSERPSHMAKNRLNLPDELPLAWEEFARYLPELSRQAVSSSVKEK